MTAHSPIGLYPEQYGIVKNTETIGSFANNDLIFTDSTGIDHNKFSFGLSKSLFNFMHGICLDYDLQDWFDFKIPRTTIAPNFIEYALSDDAAFTIRSTAKVVWIGNMPVTSTSIQSKKGRTRIVMSLQFHTKKETFKI